MGRLTTRQLAQKKRTRQIKMKQRASLQPGDMLQDRYRIVGTLGVGGFSSVYQARDMRFTSVTKMCAIKEMVIPTSDPQMRDLTIKSFEREASMLAMLDHAAIPNISDYFTEKNRSYLVIDLVRGKDLDHWLQDEQEFLGEELAIDWMIQLCDALSHLHNQKPQPIVFRDLKPSNIMLDQHKRIRVVDFGIAKIFDSGNRGTMIGTEGYSPPEQYRGEATPAGDIYALGATFHHLLTRQDPRLEPPFTFAERPIQAVNPKVSDELESLIMRCLAYDPQQRFENAMVLKRTLESLQQGQQVTVSEPVAAGSSPQKTASKADVSAVAHTGQSQIKPLWTFKCEDEIRTRPTIDDNYIFIGVYDNNLYTLNVKTGEFMWKFPASDSIASSPAVYKDYVFIGSADQNMYCIQKYNGREKWRFRTEGAIYSSPTVLFDHVFFGSDDENFYAVNAVRGKQAWKTNAYSKVRSSPFADDERVYFGTEGGYIFCLEISSGTQKWQFQAKRAVTSSPTVHNEILYIGSLDSTVYAIDASSGWAIWRFRAKRPIISSPAADDKMVFIGSSDRYLYAIDADSGRQSWSFETQGQVASSPAVYKDKVYFGSTDGKIYALNTRNGKIAWTYETQGPVISSPIVIDDIVYIGSTDKNLYALPA